MSLETKILIDQTEDNLDLLREEFRYRNSNNSAIVSKIKENEITANDITYLKRTKD